MNPGIYFNIAQWSAHCCQVLHWLVTFIRQPWDSQGHTDLMLVRPGQHRGHRCSPWPGHLPRSHSDPRPLITSSHTVANHTQLRVGACTWTSVKCWPGMVARRGEHCRSQSVWRMCQPIRGENTVTWVCVNQSETSCSRAGSTIVQVGCMTIDSRT